MDNKDLINELQQLKPKADNELWTRVDKTFEQPVKKNYLAWFSMPKILSFAGAACLVLLVAVSVQVLSDRVLPGEKTISGGDTAVETRGDGSTGSSGIGGVAPETSPNAAEDMAITDGAPEPDIMPPVFPTDPAAGETDRKLVYSATVGLKTDAKNVDKIAQAVTDLATKYDAHILTAQISQYQEGGQAYLQISVPTDEREAFIREVSKVATLDTISRTTQDVTGQVQDLNERLAEIKAERASILKELADTKDAIARRDLSEQLTRLRQEADSLRAQQESFQSQVAYSSVMVQVNGDNYFNPMPVEDDGWSLEQAWEISKEILIITASIALLITLVLLPWVLLLTAIVVSIKAIRRRQMKKLLDK